MPKGRWMDDEHRRRPFSSFDLEKVPKHTAGAFNSRRRPSSPHGERLEASRMLLRADMLAVL
ncbi:MAG: hypothetical protein QW801_05365 [Candidatus Caldarchaeum sp.]